MFLRIMKRPHKQKWHWFNYFHFIIHGKMSVMRGYMIFQYGLESVLERLARYTQTERHPVTFFMFKIWYDAMNEAILVFLTPRMTTDQSRWLQGKNSRNLPRCRSSQGMLKQKLINENGAFPSYLLSSKSHSTITALKTLLFWSKYLKNTNIFTN